MHLVTLTCPSCGEARPFQLPPCPDGSAGDSVRDHGDGCPERACVDCGTALLTGFSTAAVAA